MTSTPVTGSKKQDQKSMPTSHQEQSSFKPMRGSIKVRLLGKGFLLKKREKKVAQVKEKQAVAIGRTSQAVSRVQLKTVGKSTKEAILKKRVRYLRKDKTGKQSRNNEVKYCLVEKRQETVKTEVAELPPKKTLCVSLGRHRAVRIRKGMLGLKRKGKKYPTRSQKNSENEDDAGEESFQLPSESSHSQRKITVNKRFVDNSKGSSESSHSQGKITANKRLLDNSNGPSDISHSQRKIPANKRLLNNSTGKHVSAAKKPRLNILTDVQKMDLYCVKSEPPCKDVIENPVLSPSSQPISSPSQPGVTSTVGPVPDQSKKIPMFDAPLICDSKRMRKPSQKLIMELSEDFKTKRAKKGLDSTSPSAEHSSETDPDEFAWPLRKSAKLTDSSTRRHHNSVQRAKRYLSRSFERKTDVSGNETIQEHEANLSLPVLPTTGAVLSQKNTQLGRSPSEVTSLKKTKRTKCCCICDGTYRLSHHAGCRSLCCRSCSRFFKSKADQALKGIPEPECLGDGR